ncbi:MAG: helix-turn-helix domain-containing protein [Pseudodesulfovibrio sp.]|nr:helix-turn-helix domain-containing protein [Pseudodesulfovibrio sp.]
MTDAKTHRLEELEKESPHLKTLAELSAYLRMDEKTVVALIKKGDLKVRQVAGVYRATKSQLDIYIESAQ